MAVAFLVTTLVYPYVLQFARRHNMVDNPNARKLQRVPVPLMGGTTVFIGLFVAVVAACFFMWDVRLPEILALLLVMYALGVWDDAKDVSPALRFAVEILVVWLIIIILGVEINDFHGLWGIRAVPDIISVPLSIVAGVGIMNAVNLIDGVDGYCSSFGMMACIVFGIVFYYAGDMVMFTIALISIGALLPFFFHNVFGKTSKMFLGDGGSLMLGTLLTLFTFSTLASDSPCAQYSDDGISLVALCLAVLAVPVFDTLKVMIFRVARGQSPFHPDKTHLHHLFIELGYTHLATSAIIVATNAMIIVVLAVAWLLGASINLQVYIVILLALLVTWGFYFFMEAQHRRNHGRGTKLYHRWSVRGERRHAELAPLWWFLRRVVDSRFLGGTPPPRPATQDQKPTKIDPRIR